MDIIATTKEEADAQLRQLRQQRGVNDQDLQDSALVSSLDQALNILSDQLYQTSTHFLLELIQNADDNSYSTGVTPSLHLTLSWDGGQKRFLTNCNEVGFTFKQLDALTRLGQSTKKTSTTGSKGYIGEKGIGFKSVFKVADLVYIASGRYEFKLDSREPVGMILPILCRFPEKDRIEDHTQFLLRLKSEKDYCDIRSNLEEIQPQLLMFLHKLGELHVITSRGQKVYRRQVTQYDMNFGGETVRLSKESGSSIKESTYLVHRHNVQNLPTEPRRDGVATSEVVVAFGVKDNVNPDISTQKAFAFLPIDDFGFRFLIQADFLVVASRESLDYSSRWNEALKGGIKDAFIEMIRRFAVLPEDEHGKGLCYSWPRYLPRHSGSSAFWNQLHQNMLNALRGEDILKSRDKHGSFQKPKSTRYVPEKFRYEGKTLFDLSSANKLHLSFAYDNVREDLTLIGVSTLTVASLCDQFYDWIREVGVAGVQKQPTNWHRKISSIFSAEPQHRSRLRSFPIIPLRDGTWVHANKSHLYLASEDANEHVPAGVNISIVDRCASQDPVRRRFFKFLGIKEYSPRQVCDLILELHKNLRIRTEKDCIADAVYLFKHRSKLDSHGAPNIGFYYNLCESNYLGKGRQIYLIDPSVEPGLVRKYKNVPHSPFATLLDGYEADIRQNGGESTARDFRLWLLQSGTARFTTTPTLVTAAGLSREWYFLGEQNVVDLLHAVRFCWEKNNLPRQLIEAVKGLTVPCLDGIARTLCFVAVPTTDLQQKCPHLHFVKVPEATYENWGFLSSFAVITTCNTIARLLELSALSQLPANSVDKNVVSDIYRALNPSTTLESSQIRVSFSLLPLVFVTKPNPRWLNHRFCVWTAPSSLKSLVTLKRRYADCRILFRTCLNVGDADTEHVVNEICSVSISNGVDGTMIQRFKDLFRLMGHYHSTKSPLKQSEIEKIKSSSIFPIVEQGGDSPNEPRVTLHSVDDSDWYIPDQATLESAFRGKVNLLSLPVALIRDLESIFKILGCEDRFLSSSVKQAVEPRGTCIRYIARENELKIRLKNICQLTEEPEDLMGRLSQLKVWSVPSITITRCLGNVEIREHDGLVTIKEDATEKHIYLREALHSSDEALVQYELLEHFNLGIRPQELNLANLLMSAPISKLAAIMEDHDKMLPVEESRHGKSNDESSGFETDGETTREDDQGLGQATGRLKVGQKEDNNLEEALPSTMGTKTQSASRSLPSSRPLRSQPLRKLIPSHQSKADAIGRRAVSAEISECLVAIAPRQHNQSETVFGQRLSRTKGAHNGSGGESSSGRPPQRQAARFHEIYADEHRSTHCGSPLRRRERPISPDRSPPGSGPRINPMQETRYREIGFLGELFVYELFSRQVDDWTFENWTSKLRVEAGHPRFSRMEKDFSDLTYPDRHGYMKEALLKAKVEPNPEWSHETTFHLEVKATLGPCEEAFFVSQNQLDKMRKFDGDPNNAYILLRVFGLEEGHNPGVKLFRDPWSLYMERTLDFRSREGYKVYEVGNE